MPAVTLLRDALELRLQAPHPVGLVIASLAFFVFRYTMARRQGVQAMDAYPEPPAKHDQLPMISERRLYPLLMARNWLLDGQRADVVKPAEPENTERQRCAGVKASRVILSTSAKRNVESIHVQKYPR